MQAMWEPHGYRVLNPGERHVVMGFRPEFLGVEMLGSLPWFALFAVPPSGRPRVTSEATRVRMIQLAGEILQEAKLQQPEWEAVVRLLLLQLLYVLKRDWTPPGEEAFKPGQYASHLARIMSVTTRICADPSERCTLTQAAAECGLGVSWFSEVFRRTMGVNYSRFHLNARLSSRGPSVGRN